MTKENIHCPTITVCACHLFRGSVFFYLCLFLLLASQRNFRCDVGQRKDTTCQSLFRDCSRHLWRRLVDANVAACYLSFSQNGLWLESGKDFSRIRSNYIDGPKPGHWKSSRWLCTISHIHCQVSFHEIYELHHTSQTARRTRAL